MNPPEKATRSLKRTLKFQRILFLPEKFKLQIKVAEKIPNSMMGGGCLEGRQSVNNCSKKILFFGKFFGNLHFTFYEKILSITFHSYFIYFM